MPNYPYCKNKLNFYLRCNKKVLHLSKIKTYNKMKRVDFTEEQKQQLINLNDSRVNEILGVKELEFGKWYNCNGCILNYQGLKNNIIQAYGHVPGYKWFTEPDNFGFSSEGWIEATHKEVETALIAEAKRRGLVEGSFVLSCNNNKFHLTDGQYFLTSLELYFDQVLIFNNGKWAEVIEQEKEEIINQINELLKRL